MLLIYLLLLPIVYGFDMDYDESSSLRSRYYKDRPCSRWKRNACMHWCDTEYSWCYENTCYCIPYFERRRRKGESVVSSEEAEGRNTVKMDNGGSLQPLRLGDEDRICVKWKRNDCRRRCQPDLYACIGNVCYCVLLSYNEGKKALRHHIAHFCPNIDAAKECIFKCMKRGKPAFCGKDHVCYCGHRYSPADDDQYNSTQTYGQFKDLYQKYFGPNYADDYDVV